MDPGLCRGVQLDLTPRIRFLDDGSDRWPLLDGNVAADSTAGKAASITALKSPALLPNAR